MQLAPQDIRHHCEGGPNILRPMIFPFMERHVHPAVGLSGGLSCAGYDVHMGELVDVTNSEGVRLFKQAIVRIPNKDTGAHMFIIPPRTGCLGVTKERFDLPANICMKYYNKSTLARFFMNSSATLAEPGWCGHLTLEISNDTDLPAVLVLGQPIGQVIFDLLTKDSDAPYVGKYQNQGAVPVSGLLEEKTE